MPINIPRDLPAKEILEKERIFIMDDVRAVNQEIRPLNIVILNLMPEKEKAETQLLRLLGNSPLQVHITLLYTASHKAKTTSKNHLDQFYKTFEQIKERKYDGMIITGAPVEHIPFEEVNYWKELQEIMDWCKTNVTSTLHICWGAQAGLYHHFGIDKRPLSDKCTGVFTHVISSEEPIKLLRGFDDVFYSPHSRHTDVDMNEVKNHPDLELLSYSEEAGVYMAMSKDEKFVFITGHPEYDVQTLQEEFLRDTEKGLEPKLPEHYFPNNDPDKNPLKTWRSHANLLFMNWLNYYVYQETPYLWE
ncbi:homoserine O-acetyltransferase MetA [Priestia megaterium]|uniref:homoserine O-acetyltransferase MetA n=1 Tax=Priestia megaterium TaxID=1404 RepID=UPI00209F9905|nr:homoserine O-succinyltransferase [Priestia megaterium]MCP1451332.1 homoserine O-succinyltransferase [Priestia megaterium]MED4049891.1 homoserine O-succinyltransferase [Priestia megaterium]WJD82797.1 homoserine O-succinyltransferase [Priestia megaterium]